MLKMGSLAGLAIVVVGTLAACSAEDPVQPQYDISVPEDVYAVPDLPPICSETSNPYPPQVALYPNPTSYALQPFRGKCPGSKLISAQGGAGTAAPARVSSDGSFCIEVKLLPDAPNTITFQCIDENGCTSAGKTVQILHKTAANQDGGITTPVNVAKKQPVTVEGKDTKVKSGSVTYAVDGDPTSSVKLEFSDWWDTGGKCDNCTWVKVDLRTVYTVSKFKITWGPNAGTDYAVCYNIVVSSQASPPDPACDGTNTAWKTVVQETAGGDKAKEITINPVPARWAALLMYENFSSGLSESFDLGEFEVWGQDPNATPPPPVDRCK